ncbi:ROK family protein [Primorskyibacter flagellatus]|uniref:Glucokinase n=1 Tax=Primorskyibacter flagellatus TaxID=1387277 RepID=A0A1W1ZCM8_9RHOB|nr:ROK family protein [Primorskyibacter flagellatus]SMC46127.1 glucokinase [Primorskyibacter flagellatus]
MNDPLAIVADIGGTNTRVAMTRGPRVQTDSIRRFRNADFSGLTEVLQTYIKDREDRPSCASVAAAGPVHEGVARMTNLDWVIDRADLAQALDLETVAVLNDLQAQGHALRHVDPAKMRLLLPGSDEDVSSHAARLVVGVGTGMNAALVYRTETGTLVPPSESGHISFPVQSEEELRLMRFAGRKHGVPGVEDVLSGRGIERLYAWRCEEEGASDAPALAAAEIMAACAAENDPRAHDAVAMAVRLLGRVLGNLALIQLPFGGIYLVGGVARALAQHATQMGLAEAFMDKGRFGPFMQQFPVWVVEDDYAALTGCAGHLCELIGQKG